MLDARDWGRSPRHEREAGGGFHHNAIVDARDPWRARDRPFGRVALPPRRNATLERGDASFDCKGHRLCVKIGATAQGFRDALAHVGSGASSTTSMRL
jgi:hypothetical protein